MDITYRSQEVSMPIPREPQGPATRPLPAIAKAGLLTMGFGFLFDLVEHTLVFRSTTSGAAFPLEEHAAHLIVVVGMVLILIGIVRDGIRQARLHQSRLHQP
jgi:hypothetical protein